MGGIEMKNTVIIALDETKISALKMYLEQKNTSLSEEISKFAEQLYSKFVPQNVREFIEISAKRKSPQKPKSSAEKPNNLP